MLGNPLACYSSEIQDRGWVWRSIVGTKLLVHAKSPGELSAQNHFLDAQRLWNDKNGAKYHSAYFEHFAGMEVWRHGDFIEFSATGGIIVHGRSDATLNPGGVRIGTAEIYAALEGIPEVVDSVCFAALAADNDVDIILLVKFAEESHLRIICSIKSSQKFVLTLHHGMFQRRSFP